MAYDEGLAQRVRSLLGTSPDVREKKMFGGLAFLLRGNMYVDAPGLADDADLASWVELCRSFVATLPAK